MDTGWEVLPPGFVSPSNTQKPPLPQRLTYHRGRGRGSSLRGRGSSRHQQSNRQEKRSIHTMEASSALTESMHHITTTKLAALADQQQRYETNKSRILKIAAGKTQTWERIEALLDGYEQYKIQIPSSLSAVNIRLFLDQSRHDPSVSQTLLMEWGATLEQALDAPSRKYEHASLFGRLVIEWLEKANQSPRASLTNEGGESFEHVGRKEMYDQRKEWESIVFANDSKSDPVAIEAYLNSVFASTSKAKKLTRTPLEILRKSMGSFELGVFDVESLKTCISGVLKTDLLSDSKRKTLSEFSTNSPILREIVDVLNMQIDQLDSWSWGPDGVWVDVRRALNGKYRVYMDEEILQAVLLHFIGMKWGVHFKSTFVDFFRSGAWSQSSRVTMNRTARQRRQDFLAQKHGDDECVRNKRRHMYQSEYFLLQLPDSFNSTIGNYDQGSDDEGGKIKSSMAMKQSLLHLISSEALINTRIHGSFTILESDFRWFGPSMPHATIMAVMHFFGVPERWLRFFEKFLEAPIRFTMDGPDAQTQIRRSGVPIQHRLSDALGEAVLFCLDFAVNKSTKSNLYRLHDDIWFWGDKEATIKAWQALQHFSAITGLQLNEGKTGAVELYGDPIAARHFNPSDNLPSGPITWSFLQIGPAGSWAIDEAQVETHIKELQVQLGACKSIFSWVQAWNLYAARFLANNFGESANCLGRPHIDMVIKSFEKIQNRLFADDALQGGNVVEHLRSKLGGRFGITDIPDGFFMFPAELGGLGLINPLIPLFIVQHLSLEDPMRPVEAALEEEETKYECAKKLWEAGTTRPEYQPSYSADEPFMSLEEYMKYIEETSKPLSRAYEELMDVTTEKWPEVTSDVRTAKAHLRYGLVTERKVYDQWVMQLYGPEIIRRYGGLAMGDERLLPIGLVDMLKNEKVRWTG